MRVAYVLHTHNFIPTNDDRTYDHLASALAEGHGWACGVCAYHPPGFSIFLAGIYTIVGLPHGVWTAARLVQSVVGTITVGLIGLMALQVGGRTAALITLAIAAPSCSRLWRSHSCPGRPAT